MIEPTVATTHADAAAVEASATIPILAAGLTRLYLTQGGSWVTDEAGGAAGS